MSVTASPTMKDEEIRTALAELGACDISDVLLKMKDQIPSGYLGGFLEGLAPLESFPKPLALPARTFDGHKQPSRVVARAFPVLLGPKDAPTTQHMDAEWSDQCPKDHMILMAQPLSHRCAAIGGLQATRLHVLGCTGLLVHGRLRDHAEIAGLQNTTTNGTSQYWPVWTHGTSTVGQNAEGHVTQMGGTVVLCKDGAVVGKEEADGVRVREGDWIVCDYEENATVVVPAELAPEVIRRTIAGKAQDDQMMEWIRNGGGVVDGFKHFHSSYVEQPKKSDK